MKEIKVLGTGCAKCNQLAEAVQNAANEIGIEFNFEKVEDINKIMEYGIMFTPALVIDGEVKSTGKIPSSSELQEMLQ